MKQLTGKQIADNIIGTKKCAGFPVLFVDMVKITVLPKARKSYHSLSHRVSRSHLFIMLFLFQ